MRSMWGRQEERGSDVPYTELSELIQQHQETNQGILSGETLHQAVLDSHYALLSDQSCLNGTYLHFMRSITHSKWQRFGLAYGSIYTTVGILHLVFLMGLFIKMLDAYHSYEGGSASKGQQIENIQTVHRYSAVFFFIVAILGVGGALAIRKFIDPKTYIVGYRHYQFPLAQNINSVLYNTILDNVCGHCSFLMVKKKNYDGLLGVAYLLANIHENYTGLPSPEEENSASQSQDMSQSLQHAADEEEIAELGADRKSPEPSSASSLKEKGLDLDLGPQSEDPYQRQDKPVLKHRDRRVLDHLESTLEVAKGVSARRTLRGMNINVLHGAKDIERRLGEIEEALNSLRLFRSETQQSQQPDVMDRLQKIENKLKAQSETGALNPAMTSLQNKIDSVKKMLFIPLLVLDIRCKMALPSTFTSAKNRAKFISILLEDRFYKNSPQALGEVLFIYFSFARIPQDQPVLVSDDDIEMQQIQNKTDLTVTSSERNADISTINMLKPLQINKLFEAIQQYSEEGKSLAMELMQACKEENPEISYQGVNVVKLTGINPDLEQPLLQQFNNGLGS